MLKIEKTDVYGWEAAIRGMRNPMNSWDKSDIAWEYSDDFKNVIDYDRESGMVKVVGKNNLSLMKKLCKAGTDHRKFMRMITVALDVTSHHTWWAEFDTYKIATVRNSCSKMHRIHVKEFVADDFSTEGIEECGGRTTEVFICVMNELERLRRLFNETHEKKYWRAIIELLPMGYNLKATVQLNYEVLANIYKSRKSHKLNEWVDFCKWIETLPYSELITGGKANDR